jgi:hypothetical protein
MRADFFRPDAPDEVVGSAKWDGTRAVLEAEDAKVRKALARIFRLSSIALDDRSMRPPGASGQTVVEPGDIEWFRTAALSRVLKEGLSVRLVTDSPGGWDPALDPVTYGWGGNRSSVQRDG